MTIKFNAGAIFLLGLLLAGCGDAEPIRGAEAGGTGGTGAPPDAGAGSGGVGGESGAAGSAGTGASGGSGGEAGSAGTSGTGGAPAGCALPPVSAGTSKRTLTSSGENREYLLHVPAGYDASHPLPLLLVFHGYYGSAGGMESVTGLSAIADQKGFAIAYGSGVSQSWNAGKCCGSSAFADRPDVQYVSDVIDHVSTELCIDPKRVYATGMSNGGMLSNRLGCELAHRLAAIAPVAGPRAIDACQPSRPLPVIAFHGTEDWVVPYEGGGSGGAEPVKASFDFWTNNAACTDSQPAVVHQNGSVTCIENSACAGGARVQLCTVQGGGHQWPGGVAIPGLGDQTNDISASAALVDFVLSHSLP